MAFINKHDTNGTKGLLGKGELGYDDYTAGGDTGRVYVGTGTENIALAERLEANTMTKAQFNALVEERKSNRAGSGFDEWGASTLTGYINNGMQVFSINTMSYLALGRELDLQPGLSKTLYPKVNINGVWIRIGGTAFDGITVNNNRFDIKLPTASNIYPYDTVLTAEQIASGVIKHADASNSGLIVNGKFDTDTSGWSESITGTVSWNSGTLKITSVGGDRYAYQAISCVIGKEYVVEFNGRCSDQYGTLSVGTTKEFGTPVVNYSLVTDSPNMDKYTFKFTATATPMYIRPKIGAANSIAYFDNIAVFPADAISRSDLVFLESWHEDISEKNFVYPLGSVQYLGGNSDGLSGIANGNFTGFETYSLFGNWQTPSALIGKGYVWSSLTEAQKRAFVANPENNCYLDGDKVIQVRYRVRVLMGEDTNSMAKATIQGKSIVPSTVLFTAPVTTVDAGLYSNTSATYTYAGTSTSAISIATVGRRNQGMYHPVYNPNGSKKASGSNFWYNTAVSFTSISDCFDPSKLLTSSGYIGTVSGRPDGLFYDQAHEGDIQDLRNSSKKVEDYNRLISREFNKLVTGAYRGKQGELYTEIKTQTTTGTVATVEVNDGTKYKSGEVINIYDLTASATKGRFVVKTISSNTLTVDVAFAKLANSYMISGASSTRTKSNTLLVCDVIGSPANYPSVWKTNEVAFTTLHTAEDGTSLLPNGVLDTFKLSRKANATPLLCLRSTDSGDTWTSFTPTFNTTTNAITLTDEPATNLVMVFYQTHTMMAVPVVNSEVLGTGSVLASAFSGNSHMVATLIGKIPTTQYVSAEKSTEIAGSVFGYANSGTIFIQDPGSGQRIYHSAISLSVTNTPAVKIFPYLTRLNGKAYLNLVFKEMKHNGTSWGDDAKFNIVGNVSTTTDNNAQTVLIGQKTVELPYFIGADE